ncbi:hypothetical protein [Mariniblastus fucicola]|uniref:Uncharacterized protein n=1 Tax=Mariniblastus fucicola TaxID=980251 RepID=A0A5B9PAA9_9BACT|nr:hypothetical protein [Mariniblastus fucicola]QEG22165.1 hypothetical protein MFFC18_20260 [Mariniblastus fucicola]
MAYPKKSETKTIVGALIWIAAIAALLLLVRSRLDDNAILKRLSGYFGKQKRSIELVSHQYEMLGFGDPIFLIDGETTTRVGNVSFIDFGEGYEEYRIGDTKKATATLYGNAPVLTPGDYLKVHKTDQSVEWVVRTMMPPEMREQIGKLITDAWKVNQDELVAMFQPLIEESIADAGKIIQEDFKNAIENHREQIDKLSQRYQDELLKQRIVPLVRDEIWPIVQEESRPLAETIGQEIWQEVSVWRFGWRYIYDRSPLPEKKLTEKEFNRFVESKAVPILENHLEDFIDVQKEMLSRISNNEKVKETFSESIHEVSRDPEFRELVASIVQEVLVDNQRLKQTLRSKWQSPEAKRAMARANRRLDPTVTEIGATLFGSTKTAITPQFARVLRSKVLHKDERWLTLHTKAIGNRDEELANRIIASNEAHSDSHLDQLPMFTELESSEYPMPAAPPIENVLHKRADQE